ncbi:MAG: DUF4215 domain-containing protein [Deltaproteobacteria bacterium]|nr:DUF4215 domain-containing protein [Deltaproteobacteria bacterium]
MKYFFVLVFLFSAACNNSDPVIEGECGNGIVNKGEECDNGLENSDITPDSCRLDCSESRCGDGVRDSDEQCDGYQLGSLNCSLVGFDRGTLKCSDDCIIDTSECSLCGNSVVEGDEECDSGSFSVDGCESAGFEGGILDCNSSCTIDFSGCTGGCGNSKVESDEECDGDDFNSLTCEMLGFNGGNLSCTSGCTLDFTSCVNGCGNGFLDEGETCDDANDTPEDGCFQCRSNTGDFSMKTVIDSEYMPLDIEIADFDGDGIKDILVSESSEDLYTGRLVLYPSTQSFQGEILLQEVAFFMSVSFKHEQGSLPGICAVGMKNDGSHVYYWTFSWEQEFNYTHYESRTVDLNTVPDSEGKDQIFLTNFPEQSLVWFDYTSGEFITLLPLGGGVGKFGATDLDFDGISDIMLLRTQSQLLSFIKGYEDSEYYYTSGRYVGGRPWDLHIGDIDGDNFDDILVTDLSNPYLYFFRNIDGEMSYIYQMELIASPSLVRTLYGDNNKIPDLLMSFPSLEKVILYRGLGGMSFEASVSFNNCVSPGDIKAADVTGDGLTDIIYSCIGDKTVHLVEGTGN